MPMDVKAEGRNQVTPEGGRNRIGKPRELSTEECITATKLIYSPEINAERNVIRTAGKVAVMLTEEREGHGNFQKVSQDTVKRGVKYALQEGLVVVEPRRRSSIELPKSRPDLEKALIEVLGIDDAIVLNCPEKTLISQDAYFSLQRKLGHALAKYLADRANREFSRVKPLSWGLGGGRAVRSFARRLESLSPPERWPGQRVYSFGGSLEGDDIWVDGVPALLGSDSAASTFASAFDSNVELRRVLAPLFAEELDERPPHQHAPRAFDEFGEDGRKSTAIVGTRFGALEPNFFSGIELPNEISQRARDLLQIVVSWLNGLEDPFGRDNGYCPIANFIAVPFYVPNRHNVPGVEDPPKEVIQAIEQLENFYISAHTEGVMKADHVFLLGGGFGNAGTLDYLATQRLAGKVSLVVTSSGSAEQICDWHDKKW